MNWQPWSSRFYNGAYLLACTVGGFGAVNFLHAKQFEKLTYILLLSLIFFNATGYIANNERRAIKNIFRTAIVDSLVPEQFPKFEPKSIICIVRPENYGSDERIYPILQNSQHCFYFQSPKPMKNARNFVSLPDSSLIEDVKLRTTLGTSNIKFVGKAENYWFEILN